MHLQEMATTAAAAAVDSLHLCPLRRAAEAAPAMRLRRRTAFGISRQSNWRTRQAVDMASAQTRNSHIDR